MSDLDTAAVPPGFVVAAMRHVGLTVSDLERSVSFWCGAFGFQVLDRHSIDATLVRTLTGVGARRVDVAIVARQGFTIELLRYVGAEDAVHAANRPCDVAASHIAVAVDRIDAACAALRRLGCHVRGKSIVTAPLTGNRLAYLHDWDHHTIELVQIAEPVTTR